MRLSKLGLLSAILMFGHVTFTAAQTTHELSLQQAIALSEKNNLQIKNALLDLAKQKQVNREITAAALPKISTNGRWMDNLILQTQLMPAEFFGGAPGTFVPITFGTKYLTSAAADVSQLIFDGQVFVALKAKRGTIDLQTAVADITAETIRANIHKIYYQLVVSRTQIQLLDSTISMVEKMKHDVQIMYDNGFAEKLDIDKNEVQLTNLKTDREKVMVGIANGYNGLKILLGIPVNDHLILTDNITEDLLAQDILSSEHFNYNDRSDYRVLSYTKDLNTLNVKRYQYSRLPTLAAFYNYGLQYMSNKISYEVNNVDRKWFQSSYMGLSISLPIFNGFAINAKVQQAKIDVQKNENELWQKRNQIDGEVITAKSQYTAAIAIINSQKKNMNLAQTVYQQTKKKYEIGTGSQLEVDNARNQLQAAQTNYYTALYDAIVARTDFLKAIGKL